MLQDKDELLQALITEYAQMYMKLAVSIGVPYDDVEDIVMEAFWSFYRADYIGKLENEMYRLFQKRKTKHRTK